MSYWWYLVPASFFVSQNNYFGWHMTAQSDVELIADGITLALFILVGIGTSMQFKVQINNYPLQTISNKEEETHL